ncbi:MAG TPA: MOSC domain-containing protein [Candidatus Caenarcaniphilales bacterium]|nr:MOSC domain-containing protein [Candidatus Caenarcaniphilales bacterium]
MKAALAARFDAHLSEIDAAPRDVGRVEMIVRRPAIGEREVLKEAAVDPVFGVVGDDWVRRSSRSTVDGRPDVRTQVTLMSVRVLNALAPERATWAWAGDQFLIDFDLSVEALPPGTRLVIGSAVLEVGDKPHAACAKFAARFGTDALRWLNSAEGRSRRLRGVNARAIAGGTVRVGDEIRRA